MKRIYFLLLLLLIASVALVAAIEYDPGYLLLSYGHYTVETSIWIGLLFFALLFLSVYVFFSVLRGFISRSRLLREWFSSRGYRHSREQTTRGLIAFTEGNWQQARRILSRAAKKSETPLLNYLIAARASFALGDKAKIKTFLQAADKSTSGASIAVDLTQADLQLRSGENEQALATLTRLRKNAGKHPFVLSLLKSAYWELKDWQGLFELLPELKKYHLLSDDEYRQLELATCKGCIEEVAKAGDNTLDQLNQWWHKLSKNMRSNGEVVACFVQQLLAFDGETQAEKLIRDQLKREWDRELVDLYGRLEGDDTEKQLLHAERWLQERNSDPALLLCLGRLSIRNALWGKAREYFENSLKLENSAIVCAELGRLLAYLGEHEKSNNYFERGLISASALPDLSFPERSTV